MIQPITIRTEQTHYADFDITGQRSSEEAGFDIAVTFTPQEEWARGALQRFDAAVAEVRKGIALYAGEGE